MVMTRICAAGLTSLVFLFFYNRTKAQEADPATATIKPYEIAVGYNQTTNLIFPYAVRSVDRGSASVLAQKAKGVENILQLKAADQSFAPTNVSVVTADGRFYSFVLSYADQPPYLNISFAGGKPVQLAGEATNARLLENEAFRVLGMPRFMGLKQTGQSLRLQLQGVFLSNNNLWLKLKMDNRSQVDFQPAYIQFFLRDKKRSKRTALNETEITPLYLPDDKMVRGNGSCTWPVGFNAFTVPRHQRLLVQVADQSGGRMIVLPIKSPRFLKARRLH